MIAPRVNDQRPFLLLLASLIGLAWLSLLVWDSSPYDRFLSHAAIADPGALGYAGVAAFFVAAWTLMTVAMMLPTALPLVLLFRRFTAHRREAGMLSAVLLLGYVLVWAAFGAAAHLADFGLHTLIARSHWLADRSWALGGSTLLLAGAYQFMPLKRFCLEKCRSPYGFIVQHWLGRSPLREALRMGVDHGAFCVGCCWSLMLIMFAVGCGNLAWMLVLGSVMAIEKNLPWGTRLSAPVGVLLLALGAGLLIAQASAGVACAHDGGVCLSEPI